MSTSIFINTARKSLNILVINEWYILNGKLARTTTWNLKKPQSCNIAESRNKYKIKQKAYFVLGEEFSVGVLLKKVCKCSMTHLAKSGWSLYVAFLATTSLAEELIVGHEWYISPTIHKFVWNYRKIYSLHKQQQLIILDNLSKESSKPKVSI